MSDSADSLRDRRRTDTTRNLIRVARRFTAERGLSGFTVEELCSEAAVSRRTFFNYFASKDDAVLGVPLEKADAAAVAAFLTGARGDGPGISPMLLTDLAVLEEERWRALDIVPETVHDLLRAVEKEPRLLGRMVELGAEREKFDARLIEQRENLPQGDLRAEVAAQIVGVISRAATAEFLQPGTTDTFIEIFERRIVAARDLFATQATLMERLT
jgi:AcrR family transcriptional regulator